MAKEQYLFKNSINPSAIKNLGINIGKNYKPFDQKAYNHFFTAKLKDLSLTERINLVTDGLYQYLPQDFEKAVKILVSSLPVKLPNRSKGIENYDSNVLNGLNGFIMVALTNYVSQYGLDHYTVSMDALRHMTKCFSAESSIRYFIQKHPQQTLKLYKKWSKDKDMHVRRLVSESTRPRLPWAMQLTEFVKDPTPILPLLEALKNDPELYVRRSVANNLNDIAKDNPKVVTTLLKSWNKDKSDEMQWLIRHALRSLIKSADANALAILGFKQNPKLEVKPLKLSKKKINMGEGLTLKTSIESTSHKDQWLMVDYIVHHMKANGKLAPKVFKLKKLCLKANSKVEIKKQHMIKEITTRKYYQGQHLIQLQINGMQFPKVKFELKLKLDEKV